MSKRITVMIDDDNYTKVRAFQNKQFNAQDQGSYSFSKAVNTILRKGLTKQ